MPSVRTLLLVVATSATADEVCVDRTLVRSAQAAFGSPGGSRVVALSGGLGKLEATRAALRAGLITDLIVDESLGRALVSAKGAQQARSA